MLWYEVKKVFSKTSNKAGLMILAVMLAVVSYFAVILVGYVDEDGNTKTGIAAARTLRNEKNQWEG